MIIQHQETIDSTQPPYCTLIINRQAAHQLPNKLSPICQFWCKDLLKDRSTKILVVPTLPNYADNSRLSLNHRRFHPFRVKPAINENNPRHSVTDFLTTADDLQNLTLHTHTQNSAYATGCLVCGKLYNQVINKTVADFLQQTSKTHEKITEQLMKL